MRQSTRVLALLTCCFALEACPNRTVQALRPDLSHPERFVCEPVKPGQRVRIPPELAIDWSQVQTVEDAKGAHEAFVRAIRTREGLVAGYVVTLENRIFACSNNMQWQLDFYQRLPQQ